MADSLLGSDVLPIYTASAYAFGNTIIDGFSIDETAAPSGGPNFPSNPLPQAVGTLDQQEFLFDFYYRIWVIPGQMVLRNPRIGVNIPFDIWNAFPYTNDLTSIMATGADGLDLDLVPPSEFFMIEYRTVNLKLTPQAPMRIDANFTFNFEQGVGLFHFLADRALIIPAIPEDPLTEEWEWLTDVPTSVNNSEQRIALRDVPRRTMRMNFIIDSEDSVKRFIRQFMFDLAGQIIVPYYQYATLTLQASLMGTDQLYFDQARTDLRVGALVYILNPDGSSELGEIAELNAPGGRLDSPLTINVAKGAYIMPAFQSIIPNKQSLSRYSVNNVGEAEIVATSSLARPIFSRPGSTAVITSFDGYDVLDKRPIYDGLSQTTFENGSQIVDNLTGNQEIFSHWTATQEAGKRQFKINRVRKPEEMDYWRDFCGNRRGQWKSFLIITFRSDEYVYQTPAPSASELIITGSDYASLFFPVGEIYSRLALWNGTAWVFCKVISAEANDDGNSVCTLSAPLPADPGQLNFQFASYLMKVRLGTDKVSLEHTGLESFISLNIISVNE